MNTDGQPISMPRRTAIIGGLLSGLRVAICLLLMVIIVVLAFFFLPARLNYHITEQYLFETGEEKASVYISVLIPTSGPYQWVGNKNIAWQGDQQILSHGYVDAIRLSGEINANEKLEAILEYDVKLRQGRVSWNAPIESFHDQPQAGIESDHHQIRAKASELNESPSLRDLPYRIYSFTSEYLTYSQVQEDCISSSALMSYEIGSCLCAGYARLLVALNRASQIPSQMIVGFLYPDPIVKRHAASTTQNPGQAHAWVEYYSYGSWKMADPTLGTGSWKRMFFNRNDGRHISYGEIEKISTGFEQEKYWASKDADFLLGDFECFRVFATTDSGLASIIPIISVEKQWDGRWLNTIISWLVVTFLLCKYRNRLISLR